MKIILPTIVLALVCVSINKATALTLTTSAAISQFATPDSKTFTTGDTVLQTLPEISSSQVGTCSQGNTCVTTNASASPITLNASFSAEGSGISIPDANAGYSSV